MDTADVQDVEDGTLQKRRFKNAEIIQATLEGAGIEFIDDVGVQFRPKGLEGMACPSSNAFGRSGRFWNGGCDSLGVRV
jgi:hypothetical protein